MACRVDHLVTEDQRAELDVLKAIYTDNFKFEQLIDQDDTFLCELTVHFKLDTPALVTTIGLRRDTPNDHASSDDDAKFLFKRSFSVRQCK